MVTAPAELNRRVPKFVVVAAPPTVMEVPLKSARFVTARLVEPSVIAPAESRSSESAVLLPASAVALSS